MVKRIIFDLDNTLIPWNEEWNNSVQKVFEEFGIPFDEYEFEKFQQARLEYEKYHTRYNKKEMSRYIGNKMGIDIPDNFIDRWTSMLSKLVPEKNKKLIDLLKYLSSKYSLVVVTNWFKDQQVSKLKLFDIYEYFDEVLSCDEYDKKPGREMFEIASRGFAKEEVVMVGDTYKTDIKSAMDFGLYSYYLTINDRRRSKRFKIIRSIFELKEYL